VDPVEGLPNDGQFGSVQETSDQLILGGRAPRTGRCVGSVLTQHFGSETQQPLQYLGATVRLGQMMLFLIG
jgi:hypothetical protein